MKKYVDRLVLQDLSQDALEFPVWPTATQPGTLPSQDKSYLGGEVTFPLFDMDRQSSDGMKPAELELARSILIDMGVGAELHVTHAINPYTGARWARDRPVAYLVFSCYQDRLEFQLRWK